MLGFKIGESETSVNLGYSFGRMYPSCYRQWPDFHALWAHSFLVLSVINTTLGSAFRRNVSRTPRGSEQVHWMVFALAQGTGSEGAALSFPKGWAVSTPAQKPVGW